MTTRLPAHLCSAAMLGKVAQLSAFSPFEREADCPAHQQNLKYTGTYEILSFLAQQELLYFYMLIYAYLCCVLTVLELLYTLQWCKEVGNNSALVASYHSLLVDWGLPGHLYNLLPLEDVLETLYSR